MSKNCILVDSKIPILENTEHNIMMLVLNFHQKGLDILIFYSRYLDTLEFLKVLTLRKMNLW